MADESIGAISGKTSTTAFKFEVSGKIKKWDYVKVIHPEVGPILAQVTEIERSNSKTVAECIIIGYRTERNFIRKPRTPLAPESKIYEAEDKIIEKTIGLSKKGLYMGLLEGKPTIKTFLDPEKLLTKHLAVLAKSGAGKSYAVAVMLEELAEKGFPVVIIDPHGEYSSIKYPNKHADDEKYFKLYGVKAKGYAEKVKEYSINSQVNPTTEQLKLSMPNTPFEIVQSVPFKLSNAQQGLLYAAINEVKETHMKFDFSTIIEYLEQTETNAKWGLISAIESLDRTKLFSLDPTPISEIVKPGQFTIINLKGGAPELQQITVASLAIKLFEERKIGEIPPFLFIIEEAHSYCPERGFGESPSSKIIRNIASEGRKFGLGLSVISQRPARIDKNVLSQCTSQIILNVTNPNDVRAISSSFEGIGAETEGEIKALPIGKALVIGAADYPTFVDIRVRKSDHGGRAQKIKFDSDQDEELTEKMEEQQSELVYALKPRINKKDLVLIEDKQIKSAKLVLSPVLCINGKANNKDTYLIFNLRGPQIFHLADKLQAIDLPLNIARLSPMQKKVIGAAAKVNKTTVADLMLKTGMTFGESKGVVDSLLRLRLLLQHQNTKELELPGNLKAFLDFSKLNFMERAEYIELPGEKLTQKLDESEVLRFLQELGFQITNKRLGWLPCWKLQYEDDTEKIIDAISMSITG